MKLRVLALDFDGTIAIGARLEARVVAAIRDARRAGVMTVLVSGRMLTDILAALPERDLFDAVVAEGGAVVQVPNGARPAALARGPDAALLDELHRRNVRHRTGVCMVEVDAVAAPEVSDVLHALGSPHGLGYDRGRLVVLPPGVSKATGLREVVWRLGTSLHNAAGIGDGADDQPMLDACEIGAAVAWGSTALQRTADEVVPGRGPADVAQYIRALIATDTIFPRRVRHAVPRLRLGARETGEPVEVEDRGRNLLVAGDPRSGKTWLVGLLCEQLVLQRYAVCIVDPEGDYACLDTLPGVVVHRARPGKDLFRGRLEPILRQPASSVVVDLSGLEPDAKHAAVRSLLRGVAELRRGLGVPHRVVLDEAHYFLHRAEDVDVFDPALGGYVLATYRIAELPPCVLQGCDGLILTRIADRRLAAGMLGRTHPAPSSEWLDVLANLTIGEAVFVPTSPELDLEITRFTSAGRSTHHVRHRQKYADVGVPSGREFVFTRDGRATEHRARTLRELLELLPAVPYDVFAGHLHRGDFHRWVEEVVGDSVLGAAIRSVEASDGANARESIVRAIDDRCLEAEREPCDHGRPDAPSAVVAS